MSAGKWEYLTYPFTRQITPGPISIDLYDGYVIADLMQPGQFLSVPRHTGLILNTDGVPMFKSSKSTLWPIYLAITNLPPTIRMNLDYLLAGVWCGPNKPSIAPFTHTNLG